MANIGYLVSNPDEFWKALHAIAGSFPARWWDDMFSDFLQHSMEMGSGHFPAHAIIDSYQEEFSKPGREARLLQLIIRMCKHERFSRAWKQVRIATMDERNHYKWLDDRGNLKIFFTAIGLVDGQEGGITVAHGDKGSQYRESWERAGVPYFHGMAILLAGYCYPFSKESRETDKGWVAPEQWVIDNYPRFKPHLPPVDMMDRSAVCPECLDSGEDCSVCEGKTYATQK